MKLMLVFFVTALLIGCKSSRGVNESAIPPIVAAGAAMNVAEPQAISQGFNDYMSRTPMAAISGTLYLNGELPTPLARVQLALSKKEGNAWKEIARINTETGGTFSFTRNLPAGEYEVKVVDPRFSGQLPVTLTTSPKQDLVLMAELVKKK